jgi:hypothetical protein
MKKEEERTLKLRRVQQQASLCYLKPLLCFYLPIHAILTDGDLCTVPRELKLKISEKRRERHFRNFTQIGTPKGKDPSLHYS